MGALKAFLVNQSIDDVGVCCVNLELWLGATAALSLADLVLAIAYAGCERAFFSEILVALLWAALAVAAAAAVPMQRRTRAMLPLAGGLGVLTALTFAWQVFVLVSWGQGKVATAGGKACLAIILVTWLARLATVALAIRAAVLVVRAVPTNKARSALTDYDESTGYHPPHLAGEEGSDSAAAAAAAAPASVIL